jgi:putative hemolysin
MRKNKSILAAISILMLLSALSTANEEGSPEPASKYCTDLGFELDLNGTCNFPDGTSCDAWEFYRGECGQSHSYCEQHGGRIETKIEDDGSAIYEYALCRFDDSSVCQEQEFMEGKCNKSECSNWTVSSGCRPIIDEKGLLKKTAVIKDGGARSISDILGWNYITEINETCYSFYVAQPPLEGMTQPVEVVCPEGIQVIGDYNIDAEQAIDIMLSMDCGDAAVEMLLSRPMVPDVEPTWYITTNTGCRLTISANDGEALVVSQSS